MFKKHIMSLVAMAVFGIAPYAFGFEAMYERTDVGEIEVKNIPALTAVQASGDGTVFDNISEPFKKLFRYVRSHDYAFTVPLEADTADNRMRYYPPRAVTSAASAGDEPVEVVSLPPRKVVSVGLRGSYSQKLYEKGLTSIEEWLEENPEWEEAGPPYKVFWDPIWIPGFLKKSEVHLPVREVSAVDR